MKRERVQFTHYEAEKVESVMWDFVETFSGFAKETNLPKNDANLLEGAMMAFANFSCIEPFSTMLICGMVMEKIYGTKEE